MTGKTMKHRSARRIVHQIVETNVGKGDVFIPRQPKGEVICASVGRDGITLIRDDAGRQTTEQYLRFV